MVANPTSSDPLSSWSDQVAAAAAAAPELAGRSPQWRESALRAVADALEANADELVATAMGESHLPEPRLRGELARTTFQLRLLGGAAAAALDPVLDPADPDWPAGGRPDLRRMLVPLGPALIFAAGNFPFAFSVAGGDTAAALAAGAPALVKAHPGHPRLSAQVADVVAAALTSAHAPPGTFAVLYGLDEGVSALRDPRIAVAAFTGSSAGGRALADIAAARPRPIPFHAEMGSVNPVFVTPAAAAARGARIAEGFVGSYLLGAGQFCTKPGLLLVPADPAGDGLVTEACRLSAQAQPASMLSGHIASAHRDTRATLAARPDIETLIDGPAQHGVVEAPALYATTAAALLADVDGLTGECFGPTSVVVRYADVDELLAVAATFVGELTATVHGEPDDTVAPRLLPVVARFAGRVVWNSWPTGVAVTDAQHHGGPYPAATGTYSSIGPSSIRRFQRPVAFQGVPQALLPEALRDGDPWQLDPVVGGSPLPS